MCEETQAIFAALPFARRSAIFKQHSCKIIADAVEDTENLGTVTSAGVCLVCILGSLEEDANPLKHVDKLSGIINKFVGKTWQKPSKQKRHSEKSGQSIPHFCTTKGKLCKQLTLWSLGVLQIGGINCTAPSIWSVERLQK